MVAAPSRRMSHGALGVVVAGTLGLALLGPLVATAEETLETLASIEELAERVDSTAEDIAAQRDEIQQLEAELATQQNAVAAAETKAQLATAQANAALEQLSIARNAANQAQVEADESRQREQALQQEILLRQDELGRWGRETYMRGADTVSDLELLGSLMGQNDEVLLNMGVLRHVRQQRQETLRTVRVTRAEQAREAEKAEILAARAHELFDQAQVRSAEAERRVQEHQAALSALSDTYAASAQNLDSAESVLAQSVARHEEEMKAVQEAREQVAREAAAREAAEAAAQEAAEAAAAQAAANGEPALAPVAAPDAATASCSATSVGSYPNGEIPLGALCPLRAARGHYLRADAAQAFDLLSAAYRARFGTNPCVTDSYRDLQTQILLKKRKPMLAARPGTSNHGWGKALDMCDGINNFGTNTHEWMRVNAPKYGWFNPAWAQMYGSKPEPWHWEFSG